MVASAHLPGQGKRYALASFDIAFAGFSLEHRCPQEGVQHLSGSKFQEQGTVVTRAFDHAKPL